MRRIREIGIVLLLASSPGLGQSDEPSIPDHLKLKGDPAALLDLGGSRILPLPRRESADGPVVEAPYLCLACVRKGSQIAPEGQGPMEVRLLGQNVAALSGWLAAMHPDPVVITTPRWTLVALLDAARYRDLTPIEQVRLGAMAPRRSENGKLDAHVHAHLWAERLLATEAALADLLALTAEGRLQPRAGPYRPLPHEHAEIFLFSETDDRDAFAAHVFEPGTWALWGQALATGPVTAITLEGDEAARHRRFRFGVSGPLLRRHWRIGTGIPDWLQVGIAHYLERQRTDVPRTRPDEAGTFPPGMESPPDWHRFVRDLIAGGKAGELGALTMTPARGLTLRSRLQAWSLVHYLVGLDPDRFAKLLNELLHSPTDRSASRSLLDAMRAAYSTDLPGLERAWKSWVRDG